MRTCEFSRPEFRTGEAGAREFVVGLAIRAGLGYLAQARLTNSEPRMIAKPLAGMLACLVLAPAWAANNPAANKGEEPPEVRYAAMLEREYGPLGNTTQQILGHESTHEPVTIMGALVYRLRGKPIEKLSAVEKKLLAVYGLKEEVDNGGFVQYLNGPAGDASATALQALKDMQATQVLKPVQRALSVFTAAKPPADQVKRVKLIEGMKRRAQGVWSSCDDEFYLHEEDLAALALAYVKKNQAQISLP
jgi:hypothetical protein